MEDIALKHRLQDIWCLKNPLAKRFTWRQKSPRIHCRLDYFFVSDKMHDYITDMEIIPSIRSDHSAITLQIKSIQGFEKGRGYWKLNSSIIDNEDFVQEIMVDKDVWIQEASQLEDPRLIWEFFKYKIRAFAIRKGTEYAKNRKQREEHLNKKFKELQKQIEGLDNEEASN